jgi:hypothetical protein
MTFKPHRCFAAALALSALLAPSLAFARPLPREAHAPFRVSEPGLLQWLRSSLGSIGAWGRAHPGPDATTATPKNGSQLDPNGAAGREENGSGLDPDGRG